MHSTKGVSTDRHLQVHVPAVKVLPHRQQYVCDEILLFLWDLRSEHDTSKEWANLSW